MDRARGRILEGPRKGLFSASRSLLAGPSAVVESPAAACSGRPFGALADGRGKEKSSLRQSSRAPLFRLSLIIKVLFLYSFMLSISPDLTLPSLALASPWTAHKVEFSGSYKEGFFRPSRPPRGGPRIVVEGLADVSSARSSMMARIVVEGPPAACSCGPCPPRSPFLWF